MTERPGPTAQEQKADQIKPIDDKLLGLIRLRIKAGGLYGTLDVRLPSQHRGTRVITRFALCHGQRVEAASEVSHLHPAPQSHGHAPNTPTRPV